MKKIFALSVSCLALLSVATLTLKASGNHNYEFSQDGKLVRAIDPATSITPAPSVDPKLTVIAGNFSNYPLATYFSVFGNTVAQGGTNFPFQTWVAMPFTPTANSTVTTIQVSAGRQGSGTAGFEIGLYSDAGGIPGAVIKSVHIPGTKLPIYGECCNVAAAHLGIGIAVTAGTQYWVAVTTTASDTDIYAWAFNSTNMTAQPAASWCSGPTTYCGTNSGKWVPYSYVQLGFRVLGS